MSELNIDTIATINHVNPRKEGPNDSKLLALDVKCTGPVDYRALAPIIGTDMPPDVYTAFWLEDKDQNPKFWNVEHIKIPTATEFGDCDALFGRLECKGVTVHKFQFSPTSGGLAYLTFTITIKEPATGLMPLLAEQLGEQIQVIARQAQQGLDFGGEGREHAA